jgi:hypothetical protein
MNAFIKRSKGKIMIAFWKLAQVLHLELYLHYLYIQLSVQDFYICGTKGFIPWLIILWIKSKITRAHISNRQKTFMDKA